MGGRGNGGIIWESHLEEGMSEWRVIPLGYRVIRAMFTVLFFHLFWKLGGFIVRQLIFLFYGMGVEADAFLYSHTMVVWAIYIIWQDSVTPAFLPVFVSEMQEKGEERAWEFASCALRFSFLFLAVVTGVGIFFTPEIVYFTARGFLERGPASVVKTCEFTVIMFGGLVPLCVGSITYMILNGYKIFSFAAGGDASQKFIWAGVLAGLALILGPRGGLPIAVGFLLGGYAKVLTHLIGLRKKLKKDKPSYGFFSPPMVRFYVLCAPLVGGNIYARFRDVVTGRLMSYLPEGWPSAFDAGRAIGNLPFMLVGYALTIAILPYLCDLTAEKNYERFGELINKAIRIMGYFFLPLTAVIVALRLPIIDLVWNFAEQIGVEKVRLTSEALGVYIFILYFYALETVFMQGFFSMKNTWYPVVTGVVASSFHMGFLYGAYYLGKALGEVENLLIFYVVASVYVLARVVKVGMLLAVLQRKADVLRVRETGPVLLRIIVVSAGVWTGAVFSYSLISRLLPVDRTVKTSAFVTKCIHLAVPSVVALIVFGVLLYIVRLKETRDIIDWMRREGVQRIKAKLTRKPEAEGGSDE